MTNHEELELALKSIGYPKGMVPCPGKYCAIKGQSFFPGGRGHLGDDLPVGGIVYLGHNFDKVSGFIDSVKRGREENLTWRKIREGVFPTLSECHIWFANFFMGLIDGPTNIGALKRTEEALASLHPLSRMPISSPQSTAETPRSPPSETTPPKHRL